jgi:hypothetical protein
MQLAAALVQLHDAVRLTSDALEHVNFAAGTRSRELVKPVSDVIFAAENALDAALLLTEASLITALRESRDVK